MCNMDVHALFENVILGVFFKYSIGLQFCVCSKVSQREQSC
jgi:hypothetical protein